MASDGYRFSQLEASITHDNYRSGNIGNVIASDSYFFERMKITITYNAVTL